MKKIFFAAMAAFFLLNFTAAFAKDMEIKDSRATAEYWTSRNSDGNKILLDDKQIAKLNREILAKDEYAADLAKYPEKISAENLKAKIKSSWDDESDEAIDGLYLSETQEVKVSDFDSAKKNRNLEKISGETKIRYAVTTERGDIKLLPSSQEWFDDPKMLKYDELQGTAIDPAEAVAVLSDSADGNFVFVQSRNYFGWLDKSKIAFTDKKTWLKYVNPKNFLVVTDHKKIIDAGGKNILFQMGAKIPLNENNLAVLPTSDNGQLKEINLKLEVDSTVHEKFLPCTENNFVRQAFKFLGDEYGWGGTDESVDCSAFTEDVYRSMGIEIPRDADRQEGCMPIVSVFNNVTTDERFDIVRRAPVGSLLFKPGHVMLKLGVDDFGNPLVIHSASSYYDFEDGTGEKIYIRKVLVSDLNFTNGKKVKTIDGLTGIGFIGGK